MDRECVLNGAPSLSAASALTVLIQINSAVNHPTSLSVEEKEEGEGGKGEAPKGEEGDAGERERERGEEEEEEEEEEERDDVVIEEEESVSLCVFRLLELTRSPPFANKPLIISLSW